MCCGVLQCVVVCCSALQCVAACCRVLQSVAECCRVLQCVAVCCSVTQCFAVCGENPGALGWGLDELGIHSVRRALICVKRAVLWFDFVFALSIFHGFELEAWYSAVHMLTWLHLHTYTYIFKFFDLRPQPQLFMNKKMCTNAWISKKLIQINSNFTHSNVHICRSPTVQTFQLYKYVPKYNSNRNSYFNLNPNIKKLRLRLRLGWDSCICKFINVWVWMDIYIYIFICLHIYIHRDIHKDVCIHMY